jgi:predicted O-linked N-acetylglucosamine transferase (SPINDLY family)
VTAPSFDQAVQHYQAGNRAAAKGAAHALLAADAGHADALNLLSILAQDEKKWSEAEAFSQKALKLQPGSAIYLNSLGNALIAQGRTDDAISALSQAFTAAPNEADIAFNLGNAYREAGRCLDAAKAYEITIRLRPGHLGAYNNLALSLRAAGQTESALTVLIEAIAQSPRSAELRFNLGNAMQAVGRWDGAEAAYRRTLELDPDHADAMVNLGQTLIHLGRKADAEVMFRKAIALKPGLTQAYVGLADLVDDGAGDAVAHRRAVLAMKPDLAAVRSSLLMCLQYDAHVSRADITREHIEFGKIFDRSDAPAYLQRKVDFAPGRKLNLGVVSGDLRFHAMRFFAAPVFAARDRAQWSLTCYSTAARPDDETAVFRSLSDRWRDARHLSSDDVVKLIVADEIDVLIDLSGHAPHNRLTAFAAKPAPLQVGWGDYVDTRGLKAVDVLLGDAVHTPPEDDPYFVERVVRLPADYVCYQPPPYASAVSAAPALKTGHVTFGCFSEITKINPTAIANWAAALRAVPASKMLVNNRLLADGAKQGRILSGFLSEGVAAERIVFGLGGDHADFLAQYAQVDVILDTAPYSGGLTTCEALLMGVPVLTVTGDRFCGRHATSHLIHGGYPDGVCASVDEMAQKAKALAANLDALNSLRQSLRAKFLASPLCDVKGFSDGFYAALRSEWHKMKA